MSQTVKVLLDGGGMLTAAGTETYLYFQQGFAMREFCAFEIFEHEAELARMEQHYLNPLLTAAATHGSGLLLDALVWRAQPDYMQALNYLPEDLVRINELAIARTRAAVAAWRAAAEPDIADATVLVTGDIGPRGDGYQVGERAPAVADALSYHQAQLQILAAIDVDVLCALTMTNANECIAIAKAAAEVGLPLIMSPTVETDGRLPDGGTLADLIRAVDDATAGEPLFYMVNCAHPSHLQPTLTAAADAGEDWLQRFQGFRANASRKSHEELDNSTELDRGDPEELAVQLAAMHRDHGLKVVGGCCGTDVEHIEAIARATA